jgi:hypothetical protein
VTTRWAVPGKTGVFGQSGDDILRAAALEQPNDGTRDTLEGDDGTDRAYFIPG